MASPHFAPAALKFLRGLKRNNDRAWFEPRKHIYETELKQPMIAVVEAITAAMADFAPDHVRPAQKSMMRIYRDTRFSADKSPYKSRVAAWWARNGLGKTSGGGYYFHLAPDQVTIAAGVYMPEREQLLAIRTYLLDHHEELRALLAGRKLSKVLQEFDGIRLTRPPKGFPPDHPGMDLLLCRQWGIAATLPVAAALEPSLVKEIVTRFKLAAPVVDLLNTPLVKSKPKPLFGF